MLGIDDTPPRRRSSAHWPPHAAQALSCRMIQGHRSRRCAPSADRRCPGPDPSASDPVGITSTFCSGWSPKRIADPLPKLFSHLLPDAVSKRRLASGIDAVPPAHCLRPHEQRPSTRPCPPRLSRSYAVPCQSPYVVKSICAHMPHASTVRNVRYPRRKPNPANGGRRLARHAIGPHRHPPYCRKEFVRRVEHRAAHYVISSCTVDNYTPIRRTPVRYHTFRVSRQRTGIGGAL